MFKNQAKSLVDWTFPHKNKKKKNCDQKRQGRIFHQFKILLDTKKTLNTPTRPFSKLRNIVFYQKKIKNPKKKSVISC